MAPKENCFERLCDALLESIFERVLWKPCLLQDQVGDRLRLEAVCKRFHEVVRIAGCLEWDFDDWPGHHKQFMRYTLGNECKGLLRKIVLKAEQQAFDLIAVLQLVIPHAKDTLQEVYLSLAFSEKEAKSIDWRRVLVMLQECKQLVVLHIFLWESGWHAAAVSLKSLNLLKPFAKLQDLSLFGFAIPNSEIAPFLNTFPSLKTLELHHLEAQDYDLSSVTEAVSWGSHISGLGVKSTAVPKSLELIVGLLDSESSGVRQKALDMLADLLYDGKPEDNIKVAIGSSPGCLQKLVNLLSDYEEEPAEGELALDILDSLASRWNNRMPMAACLGCLQRLLNLFESDCETMRGSAASTLGSLADDHRAKKLAVQVLPSILQGLVLLLDDESMDVRGSAMDSLARFADDFDSSELIADMPGALQKVVSFLKCGNVEIQASAAWCLRTLAKYDSATAVAKVPRCFEGLVNLLGSPSIATRDRAAWALSTLAEDSEPARKISMVPGFWQKLVKCLDPKEGTDPVWTEYLQKDVVTLLGNVGAEAGILEAIASTPGSLQAVVNTLESDLHSTVESAVWMLCEMASDQKFRKAIAKVPGVIKKLEELITYEDFKDAHDEARKLLDILQ